jgi:hypothetical protein
MRREAFRPAVLAAVLAFKAQGRVLPSPVRWLGRTLGHGVMAWLDARRERLDGDTP